MNRLQHSRSPYLLQHANNPVDWYPWSEEAFKKAKSENKPVFLSIGYASCHWCHVMAHESFEDPEIAELINDIFIPVKVDREERPDLDKIYLMTAQLISGNAGWPLTVFLTPDKEPFFAGTYIPKENKYGRIGLRELLPGIKHAWLERRDEIENDAERVVSALKTISSAKTKTMLSQDILEDCFNLLNESADNENGGFGTAPKFPLTIQLNFLLRFLFRTDNRRAGELVKNTLNALILGGIRDHLGGGFHRYSTDKEWVVPHFEKMLYDQGLIAVTFIEAFQVFQNQEFMEIAKEIFDYVLRDLTSEAGGFYSGEDADSEGMEGKFYLWTSGEISNALPGELNDYFSNAFGIINEGNYRQEPPGSNTGLNILHLRKDLKELSEQYGINESSLKLILKDAKMNLFEVRESRERPGKDDKILTDWNGLMIAALAFGGRVFNEDVYIESAARAASFIDKHLTDKDGSLFHRYRDGESGITGKLDDYQFYILGLTELFLSTFKAEYLSAAVRLTEYSLLHFRDDVSGGLHFTSDLDEELLIRPLEGYDGVTPSGNSVAVFNLLRLSRITGRSEFEEHALEILQAFGADITENPASHSFFLCGFDFLTSPSMEIIIVGESKTAAAEKVFSAIWKDFSPNLIVLFKDSSNPGDLIKMIPMLKNYEMIDGKLTFYICRNFTCENPVTD
ncbi:MAG TPA: thioredoxin domain-containing protein, partial [Firmicutes bacterium]|nr:thioredoxin domain-containing protein [Bacillota bacterium]